MGDLSKAEKLLVAAGRIVADGSSEFSIEDLVVRAHREFPNDFSLKGYVQYPDSNSVFTQMMGKKAPLIVRGWLEKTGTKQYRLTPKGLHDLNALDVEGEATVSVQVERAREDALGRLLTSDAYELFRDDRGEEITFHQFCRFAGLSARDKWQKVEGKLATLEHVAMEAAKIGESGQTLRLHFRDRNYSFGGDELRLLIGLVTFLSERFKNEMDQWQQNAFA